MPPTPFLRSSLRDSAPCTRRVVRPSPASLLRGLLLFMLLFGSAACTGPPKGIEAVEGFELDRYLGTWYEIARLDHRFERGLTNVTATCSPREAGGIEVLNRGYDPEAGEWRSAVGKAFFVGDETEGVLEVSFFGPFYGGYNVIALDKEGYEWSLVAGPNRANLWILARSPDLPEEKVERLISEARALDFPVDDLIRVVHERPQPPE